MATQILLLGFFVLLSAFFSGSETAFVLSNKLKMEVKARRNNLAAKYTLWFSKNQEKFFSTTLIGNNIANIGFATIFAVMFATHLEEWQLVILSTVVLLLLGELFPKYLSREYPDMMMMFTAIPLRWLSFVLLPVNSVVSFIPRIISGSGKLNQEAFVNYFDREDLQELVKESEEAGAVTKKESDIINKVLQLRDQKVYEAMRPRTEVVGVEIGAGIDEVMDTFLESGYSKLPVYEENLDNIKGIIIAYDLFTEPKHLSEILRKVVFVPEARKSIDVLNDFLSQGISFAVVVDEFGGTAGIVTMEDIMEELFGEIKDEYDIEEDICRKTSDNSYILNGKIEVDHLNEKFELNIPKGDYETISGFITAHAGRIPEQNEEIKIDNFHFHIVRANNVRVELVKMTVEETPAYY
jgi:CBS domain containing-hemolysin-like protein